MTFLKRLLKIRFWPTGLLILFTAAIAINLAFVTIAMRRPPQLTSEHYYADGVNLRQIAERKAESEATGWSVKARCLPGDAGDKPLVELNVSEANGLPCDSLSGTAAFYRPSNKAFDMEPISLQFVGKGRYYAVLPHPLARGAWQMTAHLERRSQQSDIHVNLFSEH